MSLRSGTGFTGEVDEYLYRVGIDRVIGWVAIYARETGDIVVYNSRTTDPNDLPDVNLQCYQVYYRRHSKVFTIWIDGYDEYALIGKRTRVHGLLLSSERFYGVVSERLHAEWEARPK